MTLTTDQLRAIDRHLRKENWLLNDDLIAELTDHYANGIEERMANGIPFELAMRDIHNGFGGRKGLLDMEEKYVAEANRAPAIAFWNRLKTYAFWPKILIPVTLIFLLFQLKDYPTWVYELSVTACVIHGIRTVVFVYMLFRLVGWGKLVLRSFSKTFSTIPGLHSAYFLYLIFMNSKSTVLQCVFLGLWIMEFICAADLLFSNPTFRKLLRLS